jgi:hypothetical protein
MSVLSPQDKWLADSEELVKFAQDITHLNNGALDLALIPGDSIGREVAIALLRVVQSVNQRFDDLVGLTLVPAGAQLYQAIGKDMVEGGEAACKNADAICWVPVACQPRVACNSKWLMVNLPVGHHWWAIVKTSIYMPMCVRLELSRA